MTARIAGRSSAPLSSVRPRINAEGVLDGGSCSTTLEKVLERLAVTDKTTLAIEKVPEGKIRVTSGS
jgi:hypothetical protein